MSESETGEETIKSKRAPRKRVTKTVAAQKAPTPRKTPVRRTPRIAKEESIPLTAIKSKTRKAPTVFAAEKNQQRQRQTQFIIIGVILFTGVGASAAVGYTDKGQINVSQIIEERNQKARTSETVDSDTQTSRIEVPVQNTNRTANGGLVGRGTGGAKPAPSTPPVDTATSTASSTADTASSTEAVASSTSSVTESASSTEESVSESPAGDEPAEVLRPDDETASATSS
jgi:hypothetical protein